jgi:hypothetical protein
MGQSLIREDSAADQSCLDMKEVRVTARFAENRGEVFFVYHPFVDEGVK